MRFQFALIAVVVLAASLVVADDTLDEARAIEKIELLGGKVTRDESLPARPVIGVSFERNYKFGDKYIHLLRPFKNLATLNLIGTQITDSGLAAR
jgi:internalin A